MLVIDENKLVAGLGIRETDAARITGLARIRDAAHSALRCKFVVREREQVGELFSRQATKPEMHFWSSVDHEGHMGRGRSALNPISDRGEVL
jgi:hypothetical protein